jgi:hypothetical protein
MRHPIVIKKATNNYSAYVPDLPGCVATGITLQEVNQQIKEAIPPVSFVNAFDLDGLREEAVADSRTNYSVQICGGFVKYNVLLSKIKLNAFINC